MEKEKLKNEKEMETEKLTTETDIVRWDAMYMA